MTSIASHAARACLGTVSAPLFLVLPTGSELCPRAGMLESRRNNQRPRKPVFPFCRGSTDLVLFAARVRPFFAGHHWTTGSGQSGLCLGHSVLPLPCENRRLSMGFRRDIYFSSSSSIQTVYMGLSTGAHFTSTTAGRNDWGSFSPGSTELTLQPHQSATAQLPRAE